MTHRPTFIGIDLGGTKIAAAAVDVTSGALAGRTVIPTNGQEGPDAVLARLGALVETVRREVGIDAGQVGGLGIGVPGMFDGITGHTRFLPNLAGGWRDVAVGPALSSVTGVPVWLINDARAFVLAEAGLGAGRGAQTVVGITLGTGIGGGLAVGGRLHLGLAGMAGEVGHMTIDPRGDRCGCGNDGCLETFASGPSIAAMGVRAVLQGGGTRIGELAGGDLNRVTPQVVLQAAEEGDAAARAVLERAGGHLGIGVANLVAMLGPDRVILGGSVASLGEWLLAPVRDVVSRRVRTVPIDLVRIVAAELGGDAGIVGAALWASQQR